MVDTQCILNVYKISSKETLRHRREFYGLWRRSDDQTTTWLTRIRNCIHRCDYPEIIVEFLLFDRFVCGLDANELTAIQSVSESWTLKQLLEHFLEERTDFELIEARNSTEGDNVNQIVQIVKSEPAEGECSQNDRFSELPDEDDPFAEFKPNINEGAFPFDVNATPNDTEEISSRPALDEDDIDHEMLTNGIKYEDIKFSAADDGAVVAGIYVENGRSLLDNQNEKKQHKRKRHSNANKKRFACDECDRSFSHSYSLLIHKKIVHRGIRSNECRECDKCFASPLGLQVHMATHTGEKSYACNQCNKSFRQIGHLKSHTKSVHQQIRPYACELCDKRFAISSDLKRHHFTHTGERPYACDQCEQAYAQPGSLSRHKKTVHRQIRPHKCKECGRRFALADYLKRHMVTHTGERPFACNQCDKSFAQSANLSTHKKQVHQLPNEDDPLADNQPNVIEEQLPFDENAAPNDTVERTHDVAFDDEDVIDHEMLNAGIKCEDNKFSAADDGAVVTGIDVENGKSFLDNPNEEKRNRNERKRKIRSNECGECGKCFTSPSSLQVHMSKHSGEKSNNCDQCNKSFSHAKHLGRHKKSVHQQIRMHACEQCDKSFFTITDFKRHSYTHTGERPYACDQCEQAYSQPGSLARHKKTVHRQTRPFKCKECGRRFALADYLKRHMVTHTGERPFACDQCDKSFTQLANLSTHKKTAHRPICSSTTTTVT